MSAELSIGDARRIALRGQGFGAPKPAKPTVRNVRAVLDRLGAIQIDAVNVLVRSHLLPVYSRVGPYDVGLFDRVDTFEVMAHALSFVPADVYGLLRWRMEENASNTWWLAAQAGIEKRNPGYLRRVLDEVHERGALTFKELADPARRERGPSKYAESTLLWGAKRPSDGKSVLDGLWSEGRLAIAGRRAGFERVFDLPERVLPDVAASGPAIPREDAQRALVLRAATALGIGWPKDIGDWFRLPAAATKARLRELVEEGALERVAVEGIKEPAFVVPGTTPAPVTGRALLSPFDSLLWERARNVRLFGFTHSFEIYVPEPKRRYGYYVLPFLLDEALVARVDLKADRAGSTLLVQSAHAEPGVATKRVASELADELRAVTDWLGLDRVDVADRGDLSKALKSAIR